ncbi:MAG: NUDIX domain-containing protein [Anaerolineae bacterium]
MQVKCRTLFNGEKIVEAETLIQRPSVYGIVIHDGKLLVVRAHYTQRYVLPGGGIEKGEPIHDALIREIREEAGIPVSVAEFLHFETDFFYYDPADLAIHGFLFFYRCEPLSTQVGDVHYEPDEGLDEPLWVDITSLSAGAFQGHGDLIMRLVHRD